MRLGLSDMVRHQLSWLVGYIYVGNGTLGATDGVYFCDPTKGYILTSPSTTGGAQVPIFAPDYYVGATYASDVFKHYARVRYGKSKLSIVSLNPATTNAMTVVVAPKRGPTGIGQLTTGTVAAEQQTNVWSMAGSKQFASWESGDVDLSPFIAGGSGAAQNEFDANLGLNSGDQNQADSVSRGVVPCTFAVAGNSATAALRGTVTHAVICEQVVDLLDFIGGNTQYVGVAKPGSTLRVGTRVSAADEKHGIVLSSPTPVGATRPAAAAAAAAADVSLMAQAQAAFEEKFGKDYDFTPSEVSKRRLTRLSRLAHLDARAGDAPAGSMAIGQDYYFVPPTTGPNEAKAAAAAPSATK